MDDDHELGDGSPESPEPGKLKRRRLGIVKAACNRCRTRKIKCDGGRPQCTRCINLGFNKPCVYDANEGETRRFALQRQSAANLKDLQNALAFIENLRNMPPKQVSDALRSLEASPSAQQFVERLGTDNELPSLSFHSTPTTPTSDCNPSSKLSTSTEEDLMGQHQDARVVTLPNGETIPARFVVQPAVEAFFEQSDGLFHVFSLSEALAMLDAMYGSESASATIVGSACAIAATGCCQIESNYGKEVEDLLFKRARDHLDESIEDSAIIGSKICCVLAMRLLLQKHKSCLMLVETGLELFRRADTEKHLRRQQVSAQSYDDHKKTRRALLFMGSWLSPSIGFLSKSECWSNSLGNSEVRIRGDGSLEDAVQVSMLEACLLRFHVLQFNLQRRHTTTSISAVKQHLDEWFTKLSPQLSLVSVQGPSVNIATRSTVYYIHLVYLGCMMLFARRMIVAELKQDTAPESTPNAPDVKSYINDAVLAALQSARILRLIKAENDTIDRCWLCIFKAYSTLTVILFGMTRELSAHTPGNLEELSACAAICLDVLEHCRSTSPFAGQFYHTVSGMFHRLQQGWFHSQAHLNDIRLQLAEMIGMPCLENMDYEASPSTMLAGQLSPEEMLWTEHEFSMPEYPGFDCMYGMEASVDPGFAVVGTTWQDGGNFLESYSGWTSTNEI